MEYYACRPLVAATDSAAGKLMGLAFKLAQLQAGEARGLPFSTT